MPDPLAPIATDRLRLRPMTTADLDSVIAYRSRPEVYAHLSHGGDRQALAAKLTARVERMTRRDVDEVQWVMERADDAGRGRLVGDCGFSIAPAWTKDAAATEHLVARIHYALSPEAAGRGYATEVVRAMVTHLFARPVVHRVQADVFADNTASRRVLEKIGFRLEGYFLDDGIIDGRFVDATIYSLLRREWTG